MSTIEAFYQVIYDANGSVKEKTYHLDTPDQARDLRDMLAGNRHVRECTHSRIQNTVDVVFTGS